MWRTYVVAFVAAQALDAGTTCAALGTGRFHETNPIYGRHPACARVVLTKVAVSVPIVLGFSAVEKAHPTLTRWVIGGLAAATAVVAARNAGLRQGHK